MPTSQVLVYEDRLMGFANLLAESKGSVRVTPKIISTANAVLSTLIRWIPPAKVGHRIQCTHVLCRCENGDAPANIEIKQEIMEGLAELSSLNPDTRFWIKVVAEYEDGFKAESKEVSFKTPDRSSPKDINIILNHPGSPEATVRWEFLGDDSTLSCFQIRLDECEKNIEAAPGERTVTIQGVLPSTKCTVTVVAVYRDNIGVKNGKDFFNGELPAARVHLHLTKLAPLTAELTWKMSSDEPKLPIKYFKVVDSDTNQLAVIGSGDRIAQLELNPETIYSVTVETHYGNNIEPTRGNEIEYTTPTKDELIPRIECYVTERNSVDVEISDPPVFQRMGQYFADGIKLNESSYRVRYLPSGDEENGDKYVFHSETAPRANPSLDGTPTTRRSKTLVGFVAGKAYKIQCEVDCSSGDTLTNEVDFISTRASCLQRLCQNVQLPCFTFSIFFTLILILGACAVSYAPYDHYLRGLEGCTMHYTLSLDEVQCGQGNSLKYEGIDIQGHSEAGDSLLDTFKAFLVCKHDLKLYYRKRLPIPDGGLLNDDHYRVLNGWQIYTWEKSSISGYCCIQNRNNLTDQTASLHVFLTKQDVTSFRNGKGAKNFVFSETITIPPNKQQCFNNWRADSPLSVTQSAYHHFTLHVSADNMNFSSEISLVQSYVNTSDYEDPKYFRFDNKTYFPYPNKFNHPTEYVVICEAPDYMNPIVDITRSPLVHDVPNSIYSITRPEAESLHIRSCNRPYMWMKPSFIGISVVGGIGTIAVVVVCILVSLFWYMYAKHRKEYYHCCRKRGHERPQHHRDGHDQIPDFEAGIN